MKITLDMPLVAQCEVSDCAYNVDDGCHARAITVGDGMHPGCDTYFDSNDHTRSNGTRAGVGACKVSGCKFNDDYECSASNIDVGYGAEDVECLTFTPR